jgi:hypothetical protein
VLSSQPGEFQEQRQSDPLDPSGFGDDLEFDAWETTRLTGEPVAEPIIASRPPSSPSVGAAAVCSFGCEDPVDHKGDGRPHVDHDPEVRLSDGKVRHLCARRGEGLGGVPCHIRATRSGTRRDLTVNEVYCR